MHEECKNFQSRTYSTGEVARLCILDLAPEAPWRCPENCPAYERRLADVGWTHGSLIEPPVENEPESEGIASLLDQAEDIVNAVADVTRDEVMIEHQDELRSPASRALRRFLRRTKPNKEE